MKRFMSAIGIAALLAVGLTFGHAASPAGAVKACGWTTEVYKSASISRYYTGNNTWGHIGLSISAVQNTCFPGSPDTYYNVSTWRVDGFGGASPYYFMTLKVRAWDCGTYKGTWTVNTSGYSGGVSTSDMWSNCQYQADDYQTSLYSNLLTPGPGQSPVAFGWYLNINQF